MPSVIDSLVVELGIDASRFTKGQQQAIEQLRKFQADAVKGGKELEGQQKRIGESLASLKRAALGTAAVFLGGMGIKEFVGHVAQLDAWTARSARTLDISARELSAWQGAAEATGGSAAGITGALQGLSGAVQTFLLTYQGNLPVLLNQVGISLKKQNGEIKTSTELMLELANAIPRYFKDPALAKGFLSMIPGMNEESINLILRGRAGLDNLLATMRLMGGTTAASAEEAKRYQEEMAKLDRSATSLGRNLFTFVAPAVNAVTAGLANLFSKMNQGTLGQERGTWQGAGVQTIWDRLLMDAGAWFSSTSPADFAKRVGQIHSGQPGESEAGRRSTFAERFSGGGGAGAGDQEAYIRQAAAARGIDPATAVAVARSEGLGGAYAGDRGSSFGPYQLHYGGVAGGGMAVGGLGDEFTRRTGLNARDPATWRAQVDFALDQAKGGGWGPWHGWRGAPYAGIGARGAAAASVTNNSRGGDTTTNSANIGTIVIHAEGGNSSEIAGGIRGKVAASFNGGLQ